MSVESDLLSVAGAHKMYESACVPQEAGDVQRADTRAAFFAGAAAMFDMMTLKMPEEEAPAMEFLSKLRAELQQFAKDEITRAISDLRASNLPQTGSPKCH